MFLNRFNRFLRLSAVRQTLWLLGLFSLISLLAWGGTYVLIQRELVRNVDARLEARMVTSIAALRDGGALPVPQPGETAALYTGPRPDGVWSQDDEGREEMRFLLRSTDQGRILLGENTERQEELREMLAGGMQLSLVATLCGTILVGLWIGRKSQARLNTINAALRDIAAGKLDTRIALEGDDDLSLLADRINATTGRLETAMQQMRVQASNIAHDLRTPMARLRAQIETSLLAASDEGTPITPEVLGSALEQIDRITGTFEALLRLARLESGSGREAFQSVDLGEVGEQIEEIFGPVVEDAGQSLVLDVTDPAPVLADGDLLVQLFGNLIQNALRHGAAAQTITMEVHGRRVSVSDEGPGIPPQDRPLVFQPLYQGSTTRQTEGYGLGLSLVRAIADLHGAGLSLSEGPQGRGLQVTVQFPKMTEL